ncbi:MAG: hypothetical protein ABI583_08645, partial [Betaproteobacteria bacterium]
MQQYNQIQNALSDRSAEGIWNATGQPFRVLIIEDDTALASLTGEYLQKRGLLVEIEHRGDR